MIEITNIVKRFDSNTVLDHVNANLRDGEVNMIIGQSGSGKTVLLKSLIGLHSVDEGQILYDGRDIAQMGEKEIRALHREVGVLFQGAAELKALIEKYLPHFDAICALQEAIHIPYAVTDKDIFTEGVLRGRTFRVRYTVLQYLYDKGLLEEYTEYAYGETMKYL